MDIEICSRAVNSWNNLPESLVDADTINTFKSRLDKHWFDQYNTIRDAILTCARKPICVGLTNCGTNIIASRTELTS